MNQPTGKTIQIFLPDGNPCGVKIAEFTDGTVQAIFIPRAQLDFACTRRELSGVGLYFLIGGTDDGHVPPTYIGEAEDCAKRLKQHNREKDHWLKAVVCVSKTKGFTKAHVKYLEWYCHQEATAVGKFKVENSSIPTKSHVSEQMEAELFGHFGTISTLLTTLGFPLFDKIQRPEPGDLLVCNGKKAHAQGEYTEDGLIVFAGSTCNRPEVESVPDYLSALREQLVKDGVLEVVDTDTLTFSKDHVFPSPSQAAMVVLARTANGWLEWKYPDGRTLDGVKRK